MEWLHELFKKSPEIALFLSLALGYYIGKIKFGKFQLGGVAGSLLVAVVVSQVGVQVDPGVKAVLFALFIYAVGYESGPQFFNSLGKQSIREIILAAVLAITGLITVVVMAKLFGLDKGLAAGVAAGGLTQSAIIGTAGDAIAKLGLAAEEVTRLQGNVAVGYAVTYVFGSFGAIIVCVNILPKLMGRTIKEDAVKAEAAMQAGVQVLGPGQQAAAPDLVGRIYQIAQGNKQTVREIETANPQVSITIERIKRQGQIIEVTPQLALETGDIVLVVGRREAMVGVAAQLGRELYAVEGMELTMQRKELVLTNKEYHNKTVGEIRSQTSHSVSHGIYVLQITRMGQVLPMLPETVVQLGDVITIYGSEQDVKRIAALVGYVIVPSVKTDFVYMGAGLVVGLLVGMLTAKIGSIPLTLGSGGGALLSGLLFGWYRAKRQTFGAMPSGAVQILKDLGLAGFVVVVGLSSGLQAVQTVKEHGFTIFGVGVVVTILPLILTMLIGKYVLRYDNTAIFAGALSGSRSANPAFGEVLDKAENSIPTVPFAITYALANVFLTLLGPLIVALV
ncbi:MAG: aspartate-alanine antiporter [Burkholderiaceae bacterium]|uniref:Aspartate-alanine antiporter n=1 Tax=Herminiimonas contaminans TaxID=1111140 RepID=A0ABS0EPT7_9BURK|nr:MULTISPECIES: aspartate-alanine antiporter [Oxalobacteraceae]MBF8176880.1 aspartate-alanine antiporter [Herminiimonas contaminans]MBX9800425.1 aspartate-alanine antiporter [Burkholderiaceae bacterium]